MLRLRTTCLEDFQSSAVSTIAPKKTRPQAGGYSWDRVADIPVLTKLSRLRKRRV